MGNERYKRHLVLKGFGREAQEKLSAARVLVIGLGGLGLPVAQYLNAMGVGTLGLAEQDLVEVTNLQRQVLYTESDVSKPKLEVASAFLREQNSQTKLHLYDTFLSRDNALQIIRNYDLVVDASDNFPTRYLVNDACVILKKPFVYGALHGFEGQVSVFNFGGGPTYRCIFPSMPAPGEIPDCNQNGVLGVIPGIIGNLQALEVVKLITGVGEVLSGHLLIYNGLSQAIQKIRFPLNPENLEITELADYYAIPGCVSPQAVDMDGFIRLNEGDGQLQVVDVREHGEYRDFHIKGSVNIPLSEIERATLKLNSKQPVYLVCATGNRSRFAQLWMMENYPEYQTYNVEGGIENYRVIVHE